MLALAFSNWLYNLQVTLKLEAMFKRSVKLLTKNDSDLGDEMGRFGKEN